MVLNYQLEFKNITSTKITLHLNSTFFLLNVFVFFFKVFNHIFVIFFPLEVQKYKTLYE